MGHYASSAKTRSFRLLIAKSASATTAQGSATAALEAVAEADLAINNLNERVLALEA
jgi:hypothetical protein